MTKKIIRVAAAAIIDQEKGLVLAGKRNADRLVGGYWEFPGGKIEKGETPRQTAKREVEEELNAEIIVGPQLGETVRYEYDFGIVELTVFFAKMTAHDFKLVAHSKIEWLPAAQVGELNWAPADAPLIAELVKTDVKKVEF
ncbi:(deoxy)nucleoside triphosphate pyrophosphohydrolase [Lactobacillus amylolyticus]|uniref:(deoxy)nucleoside triphosphate pyrophosphohydrolase n=1 Tax=Lactobacillus amylolyticus TaxID=83683 RepID=UPI000FC9AF29|nr:(deoxy)nucleoside triphosphate pyrophosphohydrolase [Lactobacillus amylolyticus]